MTVKQLIKFLETQPQNLQVVFRQFSEQRLIEIKDIAIEEHCEPREDGWVQNKRPDKPTKKYLVLPGN
jgi:hypothetical protein